MRLVPGVAVMAVGLCLAVPFARGVELYEGTYSADSLHGTFVQWGGTASVSTIVHQLMRAFHWDTITIYDGVLKSGQIDCTELNGYASFSQYGGVHVNSNGITLASSHERFVNQGSSYRMNGGTLMTPSFGLDGGSYSQGGGTNFATSFGIAAPGYAHIEGGTLRTSILAVSGILTYSRPAGTYLAKAVYWQSGGTTIAEDFVVANGADAHIENGALHTSNLTVNGGAGYIIPGAPNGGRYYAYSLLEQLGGSVVVDGQLSVAAWYSFPRGSLEADRIIVSGWMTIGSSAIVNSHTFVLAGGKLETYASCELGRLELWTNGDSGNISELVFKEAAVVQFRNSRNLNRWSPGSFLVVKNWHGSTTGGGATQLRVGNNGSGLAPHQLDRIAFENPANLPDGDYSARMLPTGEVVPNAPVQFNED